MPSVCRSRSTSNDGHPVTDRPDCVCLCTCDAARAKSVRGSSSCGSGDDVGGVADGAVAPGPPDADVVVLAGEVVLGAGHAAGARVPVEAGNGSWRGKVRLEMVGECLT